MLGQVEIFGASWLLTVIISCDCVVVTIFMPQKQDEVNILISAFVGALPCQHSSHRLSDCGVFKFPYKVFKMIQTFVLPSQFLLDVQLCVGMHHRLHTSAALADNDQKYCTVSCLIQHRVAGHTAQVFRDKLQPTAIYVLYSTRANPFTFL